MPHELDPLQMALLSVCRETREPMHALQAHAEDWLSRPLEPDELAQAIDRMARAGLIAAFRRVDRQWVAVTGGDASGADLRFLATAAGVEAAAAAWQRYFSE